MCIHEPGTGHEHPPTTTPTHHVHPIGTSIEAVPHEKHMYETRHQTRASHKSEGEPHLVGRNEAVVVVVQDLVPRDDDRAQDGRHCHRAHVLHMRLAVEASI